MPPFAADAFEGLYRTHAPAAFRRARRMLGSEADAHEVVQDVFFRSAAPAQYQGRSSMSTFLYSAVTHACLNRIRNVKTRSRLLAQHPRRPARTSTHARSRAAPSCCTRRSHAARAARASRRLLLHGRAHPGRHRADPRLLARARSETCSNAWRAPPRGGAKPMQHQTRGECISDLVLDEWLAASSRRRGGACRAHVPSARAAKRGVTPMRAARDSSSVHRACGCRALGARRSGPRPARPAGLGSRWGRARCGCGGDAPPARTDGRRGRAAQQRRLRASASSSNATSA